MYDTLTILPLWFLLTLLKYLIYLIHFIPDFNSQQRLAEKFLIFWMLRNITITNNNNILEFDWFHKSTFSAKYLNFTSSHSVSQKRSRCH